MHLLHLKLHVYKCLLRPNLKHFRKSPIEVFQMSRKLILGTNQAQESSLRLASLVVAEETFSCSITLNNVRDWQKDLGHFASPFYTLRIYLLTALPVI
jgi:hypothetical protein